MKSLDYKIIATGSKGNFVRIEDIGIDCGISFKRMKEELYKCRSLFITHAHSDHLKPETLAMIRKEFPRIRVYANSDVAYRVPVDKVLGSKPITLKRSKVQVFPIEGVHDVPVTELLFKFPDGTTVFYATDTAEARNPTGDKIDYCFLESNFDEKKLKELSKHYKRKGYDPMDSSARHLSTQKCKAFFYANRRSKDSKLIELHMSERFY